MSEYAYWILELVLLGMALRSRRWALMVLAFSLPLSRRLPALPIPLLNYQNILFVVALFSCARDPAPKGVPGGTIKHWPLLTALSIFFTAAFINTVMTFEPDFYPGLWDPYRNIMVFRALILCLLIYALVGHFIRSREEMIDVVRATVAGIIVEAGYACFEWIVLHPGRVTGHLAEPNNMGAFLASSVALLLALLLLLPRPNPRWRELALGLGVSTLGLVGTLSRGAWLSALIGFAIVTLWVNKRVLVLASVALALGGLWVPDSVKGRLDETLITKEQEFWRFKDGRGDQESALLAMVSEEIAENTADAAQGHAAMRLDPSLQGRLVVWEAGYKMMLDYPLGVGFGVFPFYLHNYSEVVRWKASHNIYLKTVTEAGIPALLCLLALVALFCRDSIRAGRVRGDPEIRALGVGMLGYTVALAIGALGIDIFFQVEVNGQFWVLAAVVSQASTFAAARPIPEALPVEAPSEGRPLYELVS